MTTQEPGSESVGNSPVEHQPAEHVRAVAEKMQAAEVPVAVNKELAETLLGGIELLNGAELTIGSRNAGGKRFSMRRDGGDRIFVPSDGDRQLLPVSDEDGNEVRAGYLPGLISAYLKCQRAANLGGQLPKIEIDDDLVNNRRLSAVDAFIGAITTSIGEGHYHVEPSAVEAVTAYVQISAQSEGQVGTNGIGEEVIAEAITRIVPVLREVIN